MPGLELWTTALLLDISIKAALLAIAAGLAMTCFRVRGSHLRHRVWLLVLVGMLLLPGLVHLVPGISLPHWLYPNLQVATVAVVPDEVVVEPAAEELPIDVETADVMPFQAVVSEPATVNAVAPVMPLSVEADEVASPPSVPVVVKERKDVVAQSAAVIPAEDARQRSSNRWAMTILLVYLIGVAYQAVRLLLGILWTVRLVRRARTIQTPLAMDWLPRSARLIESGDVRVPLTIGYWRPVVVLPSDWANWGETFLAMVLAHEGEHVRRRDTWAALLATLNCVVYWFHPVAWFVRRRLTDLAEQVCDDTVIQITGSRGDYAQNLLEMASRLSAGTGRLQPVGVAMARKANVVRRIEAIIDRDRPLARRLGTLAALLLLVAVVPLIFLAAGLRASNSNAAVEVEIALQPGHSLRGQVVDADGAAIAGVTVLVRPTGFDNYLAPSNNCQTDEQGRFEFDSLPPDVQLTCIKDGYSQFDERCYPDMLSERRITMLPAAVIRGRVVDDATGEPVPAFEVRPDIRHPRGPARKFAHSNGEFVIENLKRGWPKHVAVEANGYDRKVLHNVEAMPVEDAEPIEFRLTPVDPSQLVVIAGRIVDEKSQPVAGAQVRLIVASGEPALGEEYAFAWNSIRAGWVKSSGNVLQFLSTTTDREGRFRLDQVRPSSYVELAWWGTGISATRTRSLEEQPREELANLTIRAEASGNVRLELDRERFREVEWILLDAPPAGSLGAVLPQNDAFEIRDAPAGRHDLLVQGAYRKSKRARDVLKRIPINIKAGETVTVDYERAVGIDSPPPQRGPMPAPAPPAPRGAELPVPKPDAKGLQGRVVMAADDAPVAGAEVWLLSPNRTGLDKKTTTTNERGEFEFTKLTEGRKILAAYYENLASRSKMYKGREAKLGEQGIVLRLSEAPSLKVKVVTRADSRPLEDATVRLTWTDAKQDHKTDANGEVVIRGLTAETWTIETHAKGYAEEVQAISLRGTEAASVTARLDPGIELYGVVRDEEGKALPGVGISVFPSGFSGKQIEHMKTEADGSFRFPYLPIMGFTLIVSREGYIGTRPDVAVTVSPGGRQELNLTLERRPDGGSVQGIVVNKAGYPVPDANIINRGATIPRDTRETTTDAEGRYRLDDVFDSLGHHRLFISAKGFAPQILEFEPGEREKPAQLNVTLDPGHRVRGRVENEEGEALAGVEIYYGFNPQFSGSDHGGTARTDSEGGFELDSLPAAPPIRFRKGGYSEIHDENLPLDGEEVVVITMRSAGVLRGRVVDDQTGQPVKSFTVRVTFSPDRQPSDPSGSLSGARVFGGETFSTEDGMFRLGDFIHGMPLQVTVKTEGYDPAVVRRMVAVPEENAEEVEFRLTPVDRSELITIAGRLVNEQGTALPGAEMRLIVATKRPFPRDAFPFSWTTIRHGQVKDQDSVLQFLVTVTDPQGRFRFKHVRNAGDIELAYWGEGVSQSRKAHLERLSAEALKELTITTKTPGIVRGKIDRKAYPNVSNIMLSGNDEFFEATLSAKRDSYEIRNVPEGSYELQVCIPLARKDEYGRGSNVIRQGRVSVQSGQAVTLNIERETSKSPPPDRPEKQEPSNEAVEAAAEPKPEKPGEDMEQAESASLEAADVDETEIAVRGTVTGESGQPIRGARLWLPLKFDGDWTAEATTDGEGAFTLHVPMAWTKSDDFIPGWVIWCYGAGRQIAAVSAYKQLKRQSKSSIEFVLGEPTDTGFEVRDPEGEPLEGARVEPFHFRVGSYDIVPETLRDLLAKETDAEGRVRLPEIARNKLFTVRVTADSFGIQELRLRDSADEPAVRTIQLRPTGRIEGRLVSDNEAAIRKRRVYVSQEDYVGEHTSGAAMVETDEEGRFVVPALAEGKIRLGFRVDRSIPLRPRIPEDLVVYAGETTQVEVPMEKTVRVRGRVQTKGEELPVAGAMMSVQYGVFRQSDHIQTDEDGWFEADVLAGTVRRQLIMKPDQYSEWVVENAGWQHPIDVPKVESFELPPLELIETTEVAGQLVDRDGQPVANAHVRAISGNRVYAWGTSDSDGRFTLRLPEDFHVEKYDAARTHDEGQVETSVKQESPLVLQLTTPLNVPDDTSTSIPAPFTGRLPPTKQSLLQLNGGNASTTQAVNTGLKWLAQNQQDDGAWSLTGSYADGARNENREAATAMALLAFQGDGNTTERGDYRENVRRGWDYLLRQQDTDGCFFRTGAFGHRFYTHGQATIAICELFAMTKDPDLRSSYKESAEKAIDYCVKTQSPRGGWKYTAQGPSDLSVTGWILMALHTARQAGLEVPDKTLNAITKYLDQIAQEGGSRYPYEKGRQVTRAMTAEGLLCRQVLGWQHSHPELREGVDWLLRPENELSYTDGRDVYYWYYVTQLMYHMGGEPWQAWNRVMCKELPLAQEQNGPETGSWHPEKPSQDEWGGEGGRLFVTCLSLYILEVYYRHLPLYERATPAELRATEDPPLAP